MKTNDRTTFLWRAAHKISCTSCDAVKSYNIPFTRLARQNQRRRLKPRSYAKSKTSLHLGNPHEQIVFSQVTLNSF